MFVNISSVFVNSLPYLLIFFHIYLFFSILILLLRLAACMTNHFLLTFDIGWGLILQEIIATLSGYSISSRDLQYLEAFGGI